MKGSLWTLFANKNVTHVHAVFLDAFRDLTQSGAKGAAALVHMYDNLNDAPKSTARLLAGYITLLQCWIYEHFPYVGSVVATEDYDERKPRACHWKSGKALPVSMYRRHSDRLMSDVVCWIWYGDHRAFREFKICLAPSQCSPDYMNWFYMIYHPFMSPAQPGDPPRHPPVQHHDTFVELDVA
ncbi:Protein MAIN-LIKE 2 [Glycine soja]